MRRSLRSWLWKPSVAEEVDGELAFHLEMRTREYLAEGLPPDAAREKALRRFGDVRQVSDVCRRLGTERDRDMRRTEYLGELRQDVAFGLRQIGRNPGFASVAILTLALGIGATTAIFSAVQAVVLRAFPYREPARLVRVFSTFREFNRGSLSRGNFTELGRRSTAFESIAALQFQSFNVTETGTPERVVGARVSGQWFTVLGMPAAVGRTLSEADDEPGRDAVVVLSHRLWQRMFGGDPSAVGRDVRLNGETRTVVGVMPRAFDLTVNSEELWVPIALTSAEKRDFDNHFLTVAARLKPDVTLDQARGQLSAIARQLQHEQPRDNAQRGADVAPYVDQVLGDAPQRLYIVLAAVGLVLLIACANVANLLLARGTIRSGELAVRTALGAGRGRLVRQLLTESVLLGALGAAGGLVIANVACRTLIQLSPPGMPRLEQARLDPWTLAVTMVLAVASSLLSGLAPAWRATRASNDALRGGRSGGMGAPRDRLRNTLIATEVALALLLLVGSGLLIRTALALSAVDPGFEPKGVISARVALPRTEYLDDNRIRLTLERMVEETRRIPGVTSAAVTSQVPMSLGGNSNGLVPEGRPATLENAIQSQLRLVSTGYFETMGIHLKEGRPFTEDDHRGAQKVMIVSETLARAAWPGESAIGKRMSCCDAGADDDPLAPDYKIVIGVAAAVRWLGPAVPPQPEFYLPLAQAPDHPRAVAWEWVQRTMYIVARTPNEPAAAASGLVAVLRAIDPNLPLFNVRTMEERIATTVAANRFHTVLLTLLGSIGLVLAAVGIYGVITYFVSQRTAEMGMRLALGASPADLVGLVVRQALKPVLAGLAAGLAGALVVGDVLVAQLYGVTPRDPLTIAAVCLGLVLVALMASWVPARRAAHVHPAQLMNTV
jgi:predicted permease